MSLSIRQKMSKIGVEIGTRVFVKLPNKKPSSRGKVKRISDYSVDIEVGLRHLVGVHSEYIDYIQIDKEWHRENNLNDLV